MAKISDLNCNSSIDHQSLDTSHLYNWILPSVYRSTPTSTLSTSSLTWSRPSSSGNLRLQRLLHTPTNKINYPFSLQVLAMVLIHIIKHPMNWHLTSICMKIFKQGSRGAKERSVDMWTNGKVYSRGCLTSHNFRGVKQFFLQDFLHFSLFTESIHLVTKSNEALLVPGKLHTYNGTITVHTIHLNS